MTFVTAEMKKSFVLRGNSKKCLTKPHLCDKILLPLVNRL